jgi:hypothetical protein
MPDSPAPSASASPFPICTANTTTAPSKTTEERYSATDIRLNAEPIVVVVLIGTQIELQLQRTAELLTFFYARTLSSRGCAGKHSLMHTRTQRSSICPVRVNFYCFALIFAVAPNVDIELDDRSSMQVIARVHMCKNLSGSMSGIDVMSS